MFVAALLLAFLAPLSAQPGRFGLPACSASDQELAVRTAFILCHSSALKVPVWTAYELKPEQINGSAIRPNHFRHDYTLSGSSAYDSDYRHSGFSRGHMVPASDLAWSETALHESFLLSNAVPQRQSVNSGKWSQLEARVRRIAAESDAVYVFSGPVFDRPQVEFIGENHVAVPTHTFKVVLAIQGNSMTMYAAIVPNDAAVHQPLDHYAVTVEEVQRRTALDFFNTLDQSEQLRLESRRVPFSAKP